MVPKLAPDRLIAWAKIRSERHGTREWSFERWRPADLGEKVELIRGKLKALGHEAIASEIPEYTNGRDHQWKAFMDKMSLDIAGDVNDESGGSPLT